MNLFLFHYVAFPQYISVLSSMIQIFFWCFKKSSHQRDGCCLSSMLERNNYYTHRTVIWMVHHGVIHRLIIAFIAPNQQSAFYNTVTCFVYLTKVITKMDIHPFLLTTAICVYIWIQGSTVMFFSFTWWQIRHFRFGSRALCSLSIAVSKNKTWT